MSAQHDPTLKSVLTDSQIELLAKEASEILQQQQNANLRYAKFAQKNGGRPEEVLISFAMSKLENKIVIPQ